MATGLADSVLEEQKMAAKRNDIAVKVDAQVVADARIAASYKGLSLAEYVSEVLRPIVLRDIEEGHAQRMKPATKPKGSK
jgi:hypothetical protein